MSVSPLDFSHTEKSAQIQANLIVYIILEMKSSSTSCEK